VLSPDDHRFAILAGDSKAISKAPGIGAKTAQRVIIDLKDKLSLEDTFEHAPQFFLFSALERTTLLYYIKCS
jgi:Holliday junction DNA helicase RuvA